ncbi:unnamed protein product [Rhizoctonia solani]|uniref:Uncharacterized protein n=1 Tax=Rhizoctonia solani TaxID=456999 RepID=A0A8H3GXW0_9AGAM|nr:unnamed protein product [Rhizoctonia solani]
MFGELLQRYPPLACLCPLMNMVQTPFSVESLCERLPSNTQRYDNTLPVPSMATTIPSGLFSPQSFQDKITMKLPNGWQCYHNPAEGRPYFWNSSLRILTESNVADERVLGRIAYWSQAISPLLNKSPRNDYDIVLSVSEGSEEGMGRCGYYLVDYNLEVVFWLREVSTTSMGLSDVRGPTHLNLLLSEQFWIHCEYMPPSHRDFTPRAQEVIATLGTLCIDASSSTGSVSPFHKDECKSYSESLTQVLETGRTIQINWCLARVKSLLTQSRIINLFGELNARADRNVVVNGQFAPSETTTFTFWSIVMFGIPRIYLARWNSIWVDRVTYTREWKKLTKDITEELIYGLIASGAMMIANTTLMGLTSSNIVRVLAAIGMMISLCGGYSAASLLSTLRVLGGCAADAANFIQMNEDVTSGLQGMALEHSIPWTLIVWSGLCLLSSGLWELTRDMFGFLGPRFQLSSKDMMIPVLVIMTYLYGRGYFRLARLYDMCSR